MTERQEFVNEYGVYMELIYTILKGDMMRIDEVFEMKAHKFMFLSVYLLRKRKAENKK